MVSNQPLTVYSKDKRKQMDKRIADFIRMIQSTNLSLLITINLIVVFVLSGTLLVVLDTGIGFYISYKYREIEPYASVDDPTFQHWKTPMHIDLLISIGLLCFFPFVVLWRYVVGTSSIGFSRNSPYCGLHTDSLIRFFTISFQPRAIGFVVPWETREQDMYDYQDEKKYQDEEGDENVEEYQDVEGHVGVGGSQNNEGVQNWEGYQDMEGDMGVGGTQNEGSDQEWEDIEEDENLVEVTPRTLAPLLEIRFSPDTPMLSSVLKMERTPKPSIKKTTAGPFQPRHPLSARHRRSHTPQTPTQALPILPTYRKRSYPIPRWEPTSVSKQCFRGTQGPNQTLPYSALYGFPSSLDHPPIYTSKPPTQALSISEEGGYSQNILGEDDIGRKAYLRSPIQFRPQSSPREVANISSSTLSSNLQ